MGLKSVIENNSTRGGMAFDLAMQALIIVSLVSFSIDTIPDLQPRTRELLGWVDFGCVAVFTVEYLLRLAVATRKLRFVFSFFGLVDLIAIVPFYIASGLDLRSLRAIRLLRLFRAFKLFRYSKAIRRFHRAFIITKEELVLFFSVTVLLLFFSASGIYFFENPEQPEAVGSIFDGLWWALSTLTTVGYGDVYPVTAGGKWFTFLVLMLGLGVVAVPTALIASALSQARDEEREGVVESDQAVLQAVNPVLPSKDVRAAIQFYVERLGFTLLFQDSNEDPRYAGLRRDDVELHIQWHDPEEWAAVERPMLRFVVKGVVQLHREYQARDVFHGGTQLRETEWGTHEFAFYDLDQNGLTFYADRPRG